MRAKDVHQSVPLFRHHSYGRLSINFSKADLAILGTVLYVKSQSKVSKIKVYLNKSYFLPISACNAAIGDKIGGSMTKRFGKNRNKFDLQRIKVIPYRKQRNQNQEWLFFL